MRWQCSLNCKIKTFKWNINHQTLMHIELIINCILVSEKHLLDGREYLGCKYSNRRRKPERRKLVEHLKQWILKLSVFLPMLSSFLSETFHITEVHLPELAWQAWNISTQPTLWLAPCCLKVNSTLPACDTHAADEWHRMCCDGGKKETGSARGSVNFSDPRSSYFVNIGADIRS